MFIFEIVKIFAYFFSIMAIGAVVLKFLPIKAKFGIKAFSLLYGLGAGCVTLEMFILSLFGVYFSFWAICTPWVLAVVILALTGYITVSLRGVANQYFEMLKNLLSTASIFKVLFLILSAVLGLYFMAILIGIPLSGWDAWSHWGFKAKIFYIQRKVPFDLYLDKFSLLPVKEYPLNVNLIQSFFYMFLGKFDDSYVKAVFFGFFVMLTLYFYSIIKEAHSKFNAYLFTFFLASLPMFKSFAYGYYCGYADMVFTYFNFISVTLLWAWLLEGKQQKNLFYLSSIFCAFAMWTKVDGIILLAANLVCLCIFTKNIKNSIKEVLGYFAAPFIVNFLLYSMSVFLKFPLTHLSEKSFIPAYQYIERFKLLLEGLWKEILNVSSWNIFFIVFVMVSVFCYRNIAGKKQRFIFVNLLLQFGLYAFMMMIDCDVRVMWNSLSRLLLPLMPLVLLLLSGVVFEELKELTL
jgi:hypothetical protein